jgi:solute carrier family 15 oligopeptide transporter 1
MLAAAIAIATVIFVLGHKYYRTVPAAGRFLLWDLSVVGFNYLGNFFKVGATEAYKLTSAKHSEGLLVECFDLVKVFIALLPAPFFWAAFDQNGSTWQDMGSQMNSKGFINTKIMNNAVNPILIVILAPIFAQLYPIIDKKWPNKFGLLQRMTVGMFLAGVSFIIAGVLQNKIDATCTMQPNPEDTQTELCISDSVHIGWQLLMYLIITTGEVLFSISGLNFTYVEVGKRLKASCAAIWLLFVAFGNMFAALLLEVTIGHGWSIENFFYLVAGICFASCVAQYLLARNYVPKALRATANI